MALTEEEHVLSPESESQLLDVSEALVPSIPKRPSQTVTFDFDGILNPPLLLQTNESQCGGQLWPGGMVLAEYLLRNKTKDLVGKTIVELGAGSGLVSLAIALHLRSAGLSNGICITDGLDVLIPLIEHNISINAANIIKPSLIHAAKLSWGKPVPDDVPHCPDIVLAADCCYIEESFPLLLRTLEELIGEETVCYFCYKKRRRADRDMIRMLKKVFEVVEIEGDWQRKGAFVYEIRRKQGGGRPLRDMPS